MAARFFSDSLSYELTITGMKKTLSFDLNSTRIPYTPKKNFEDDTN